MSINCGWVTFLVDSMYGERNGSEGWQLRKKPTKARRTTVNDMCGLAYCRQGISETAGMYVCLKDYVPDWLYLLIALGSHDDHRTICHEMPKCGEGHKPKCLELSDY